MIYSYHRSLFRNKEEWMTDTHNSTDDIHKHYAAWRKPYMKDSIYLQFYKQWKTNLWLKNTQAVVAPEGCRWRLSGKGHERTTAWDNNILYPIEVCVALLYAYMGSQEMGHLRFVQNKCWILVKKYVYIYWSIWSKL